MQTGSKDKLLAKCPADVRELVHATVLAELHLLARGLLRRTWELVDAVSKGSSPLRDGLHACCHVWQAIHTLGCFDGTIVRAGRAQNDAWIELLDDPYDMRANYGDYSFHFEAVLQPLLLKQIRRR